MLFSEPPFGDCAQRLRAQVVELVSTLALACDQPGSLENLQMLRDSLTRDADLVFHRQAGAELEQSLPVAIAELVENRTPYRRHYRFEYIGHFGCNRQAITCLSKTTIGKRALACQDKNQRGACNGRL